MRFWLGSVRGAVPRGSTGTSCGGCDNGSGLLPQPAARCSRGDCRNLLGGGARRRPRHRRPVDPGQAARAQPSDRMVARWPGLRHPPGAHRALRLRRQHGTGLNPRGGEDLRDLHAWFHPKHDRPGDLDRPGVHRRIRGGLPSRRSSLHGPGQDRQAATALTQLS